MAPLRRSDLGRVAARSALLQATWNYERQQGLGWAWSLEPVLARLYADRATLCQRLAEHTAYFNTQPTLASVALGAVAGLEELRSGEAAVDGDAVARVKAALGSALAAIGDRLFWFTLRPFVACLGVILALGGSWTGALIMWLCYNVLHLWMRWRGVTWGYTRGPGVLGEGLRAALEKLVNRLGALGSVLVGILIALLLVPGGDPRSVPFQMLMVAGLLVGLLTSARARPTPSQWALGLGALALIAAWVR